MLNLLDVVFLCLHLLIITFNLLGWIWVRTRKAHLWVMMITIFSWLVLGLKYGLGYCFLTDLHWNIKRQLGETDLPASFIKYFLDKYTSIDLAANTVDLVTGLSFGLVVLIALYLNLVNPRMLKRKDDS